MRMFASLLLLAGLQAGNTSPKNLKVLTPDVNLQKVMRDVSTALGVQCNYCHQQSNFASDENPKKENADTFLVMPAFRAAIGVECNFCHVFGEDMTRGHTNERQLDGNPKKLIARNMLRIMQRINTALFPTEDIDIVLTAASEVPEGKHFVT